jgi:hypothetical protein
MSPECLAYEQANICATIEADYVGGVKGWANVILADLNKTLASNGCPPVGAAAAPSPATLAQEAYGLLQLPSPTIHRSPPQNNLYQGLSYTWVNLWTWFWTDPSTYHQVSKKVSVTGVSATATAKPVALVFDAGDGSTPVPCAGPGRAWTDSDANNAPANGCGYQYRHTTGGKLLTATVSIVWDVTWTGTGGVGGAFPGMRTQATSQLQVLDIQVVNTHR